MDDIVLTIAKALNTSNILWGIGGSYLLKAYGIVEEVHDLDILVAEKDIDKAIQVLDTIANRTSIPMKKEYKTKHFYVYSYAGLSIDVMSGFRITHPSGIYEFILDEQAIVERRKMNGIMLPYTSLEDWLISYKLMKGRGSKVAVIENYLNTQGIAHKKLLERNLEQTLPAALRAYIENILR